MDVQPIGRRVIVAVAAIEEKSAGGILLPKSVTGEARYAQAEGVINSMGSDAFTPNGVEAFESKPGVGDKVTFRSYSGSLFMVSGKTYRIMFDADVMMKVGSDVKIESA